TFFNLGANDDGRKSAADAVASVVSFFCATAKGDLTDFLDEIDRHGLRGEAVSVRWDDYR
ncbi:hypothetical protein GWI33_012990, partial [Rhynchophorus ferrugineus]